MIWFLINSWVRVLIWKSWSFLRWWRQKILCGKDMCCSLCCWLCWMCVTGKSRSVRLSISSLDRFRKIILLDESQLLARWPKSSAVLRMMFNSADKLIKNWEAFKDKFAEKPTLKNKTMLIPIMYVSWELCDETLTRWNKDIPIAWPDPKTLRCATTWTRSVYMYVFVYVYHYIHI